MEVGDSSGGGAVAAAAKWWSDASRAFQYHLDRSTPHATGRWLGTLVAAAIYALRVYMVQGFYIVTYGLGIYLHNLLIGFPSPMVDPELDPSAATEGPAMPTWGSDEFKPFIRRLPEFKFWRKGAIGFLATGYAFLFSLPVTLSCSRFRWRPQKDVCAAARLERTLAHGGTPSLPTFSFPSMPDLYAFSS